VHSCRYILRGNIPLCLVFMCVCGFLTPRLPTLPPYDALQQTFGCTARWSSCGFPFWFMKRFEFKSAHFLSQCFQYMRVVCPTGLASPVFVRRSAFQRAAYCSTPSHSCFGLFNSLLSHVSERPLYFVPKRCCWHVVTTWEIQAIRAVVLSSTVWVIRHRRRRRRR